MTSLSTGSPLPWCRTRSLERLAQHRVDGGALVGRQAAERQAERIGDGLLGGDRVGEGRRAGRVGVLERPPRHGRHAWRDAREHPGFAAAQRRARQPDPLRQGVDALGVLLPTGLAVATEAREGDGGAERPVGPMPLLAVLGIEIMVE
jgi:hypothetical protein